jgi:hypothetical protein
MVDMVKRFAVDNRIASTDDLRRIGLNPTNRQQADVSRRMKNGGTSFSEAWPRSFVQDKYGAVTTHWRKLEDRVRRGVGNPCPLVLIGLPASIVAFDEGLDLGNIANGDETEIR